MNYDDIIDLPNFKNLDHRQMSHSDRAAQFAPFKSLVGYEEMIQEEIDKLD